MTQGSYQQAQQYQQQQSAQWTESENWNRVASVARSSNMSMTQNWNDEALAHVAERFGGDRLAAATWASHHPLAFQAEAQGLMEQQMNRLNQFVGSAGRVLSEGEIRSKFEEFQHRVPSTVNQGSYGEAQEQTRQQNLGPQEVTAFQDKYSQFNQIQHQKVITPPAQITSFEHNIQSQHQSLETDLHQARDTSLALKTIDSVGSTVDQAKDLLGIKSSPSKGRPSLEEMIERQAQLTQKRD